MATDIPVKAATGKGLGVISAALPVTAANEWIAAVSTMEFANDGRTVLWVANQSASPVTVAGVSPDCPTCHDPRNPSTVQLANSLNKYGPFEKKVHDDANRKVQLTFSDTTDIFVSCQRM